MCVRDTIREHVRVAIIYYCNHWRQYLQALSKLFRVNSKYIFQLALKWLFLWVRYSTPQRGNYGVIFKDHCTVRFYSGANFGTHWLKQNTRVCAGVDIWWPFGCECGCKYLQILGSVWVSEKVPTYPSPKLTFFTKWEVSFSVSLEEG